MQTYKTMAGMKRKLSKLLTTRASKRGTP